MFWGLFGKKQNPLFTQERELRRQEKVTQSQQALIHAATSTANAAEDVTSMLKARLDDSLRQIEVTAQLLADALIVVHSDGQIDSFNNAAERIFGWSSSDVRGEEISLLFVADDDQELISSEIMNRLFYCHEGSLDNGVHMNCVRGKRKDGEKFWVEVNLSHVERADGTSYVLLVCRDATKRIETQLELEMREQRFRSIFEACMDGVLCVRDGKIISANPAMCDLLSATIEEIVGSDMRKWVADEHRELLTVLHELRMKGDRTARTIVVKLKDTQGQLFDVLANNSSMDWDDGEIAGLFMCKNIGEFM